MKELARTIITYEALDGTIFDTKIDCSNYEHSLPRHLRFCLINKITQEQLIEDNYFVVGYTTQSAHTEYKAPAFLREGGEYKVYTDHDHTIDYFKGVYSDVISIACENENWWCQTGKYIKKIKMKIAA